MAKIKRIIEVSFIVIASSAVLAQMISVALSWREGRQIRREIWRNAHVSVYKVDPKFPPGMLLEYENASKWTIAKTRFRLVFEFDGREVARTDRDYGEIKPGRKEKVLLKSVELAPGQQIPVLGTKVKYRLLVFPDNKKPLPEISGEIELL